MIAPTNCNPDCDCAQRMVRCQRATPVGKPISWGPSAAQHNHDGDYGYPPPPCGTPDQYGWSCCGRDPCARGRITDLTFDDVERISESADKYDRIAAAIEKDAEWFVDDSIDDADIAKGLRLAAKALRNGVQP